MLKSNLSINYKTYRHIVPSDYTDRERLSKYLISKLPFLETGKSVKKALKKREIRLNGDIGYSGDWVEKNDTIVYRRTHLETEVMDIPYEVVHSDEHMLIINKPPGLLSSGHSNKSLQSALHNFEMSTVEGGLHFPHLVHRLDRQTSGLIIAARTIQARRRLGEMIGNREITKEYSLIVEGYVDPSVIFIDEPIDDKTAKTQVLEVRQLATTDDSTYLRVRLHTGRTHQIRKHLLHIGHPIVGDDLYNKEGLRFGQGLFLMADYISFLHPCNGSKVELSINLHKKFLKYLRK